MSQNPFLYYFRLVQGDSIVRRAQWKELGERSKSTEFLHLRASRKGILPRLRRLRLDAQRLSSSEKAVAHRHSREVPLVASTQTFVSMGIFICVVILWDGWEFK